MLELKERETILPTVPGPSRQVETAQLGRADATQRDPNGITRDTRLVLPVNPWKFRAYLSGPQNVPSGASPVVLALDTLDFDSVNGWNSGTSTYTIPVAGYYHVASAVAFTPVGTIRWLVCHSHIAWTNVATGVVTGIVSTNVVNGTYGAGEAILGGGTTYNVGLGDLQYFNAGDTLVPKCSQQNDAGLAMNATGGWGATFMSLHLISG